MAKRTNPQGECARNYCITIYGDYRWMDKNFLDCIHLDSNSGDKSFNIPKDCGCKYVINPHGTPLVEKEKWFNNPTLFRYSIFGREICPETKKPHLQGFFSLIHPKGMRVTALKKHFLTGHITVARGTPLENKRYCSKVR